MLEHLGHRPAVGPRLTLPIGGGHRVYRGAQRRVVKVEMIQQGTGSRAHSLAPTLKAVKKLIL